LIKQPSTLWLFNVAMEKCLILNNRNNRQIIFGRVWTNLMGLGIWDAGFRKD
jgi:isopentenyldiphosphate isomerase